MYGKLIAYEQYYHHGTFDIILCIQLKNKLLYGYKTFFIYNFKLLFVSIFFALKLYLV